MVLESKYQVLDVLLNGGNKINKNKTIIVFRDKLLLDSETFISRSYENFSEYKIVYACSKLGWSHLNISDPKILLCNNLFSRFLFTNFGYIQNLNELKKINPSLIHAHFGKSGALAIPIAKKLKIPLIVTFHGGDITKHTHLKKSFFKSVFRRRVDELKNYSSAFLAVSKFISKKLLSQDFPKNKLFTHYLGIDLDNRSIDIVSNKKFLFIGRLVEKKGVDLAINAVKKLNKAGHNINLDIVGSGSLEKKLKFQTGVSTAIKFLGWKTKKEIDDLMKEYNAIIVPSKTAHNGDTEGLPTVVLEALKYGKLVIASNHSGIPEIIKHNETGLLFEENNLDQLCDLILESTKMNINDKEMIIKNGQEILRQKFNSSLQSKKLEKFIGDLLLN